MNHRTVITIARAAACVALAVVAMQMSACAHRRAWPPESAKKRCTTGMPYPPCWIYGNAGK